MIASQQPPLEVITLSSLARALDTSIPTLQSRVKNGSIHVVAIDTQGRLLFPANEVEQYRTLFNTHRPLKTLASIG